ncbi:DUF3231 family protein [Ammoniphilus sp. CFH 90114]|uniref:DUF3231 family protein n=1 Tax=Ammoniphilus sp. CFH 90114 TaxID=2493665 RepID=UPI00100EC47C|nr:DUF3231 family protein [Ammoniphilus sp. CFH 90114]RXT02821.1 DUF3231 family protein [Ammoniphilus sp. CFH 90114]
METQHNPKLVSTELANLWTQYMNDSMAICVINYMLKKVEDDDIRSILEFSLSLSKRHTEVIKGFLSEEEYPIPYGFTDGDVNLEAPRLFSDSFFLKYMHIMAAHGMTGYAVAFTTSARADMRKFYADCNNETIELFNRSLDLLLSKGLYTRPPYLHPPEMAQYVKKQGFLTGWFGNRRPLNGIEISNITFNMNKTVMGKAMVLGFGQVAQSKDVREYLMRGTQLSSKHLEIFSSLLHEDNLPSPPSWDSEVTNSTISPFSDKLIMFHTGVLTQTAVAFYGAALAVSMRRDLATQYTRLTAEMEQYGEDGANILINNGWMEQPPTADDRVTLASGKK